MVNKPILTSKTGQVHVDRALADIQRKLNTPTPLRLKTVMVSIRSGPTFSAGTVSAGLWISTAGAQSVFLSPPTIVGELLVNIEVPYTSTTVGSKSITLLRVSRHTNTVEEFGSEWTTSFTPATNPVAFEDPVTRVLRGSPVVMTNEHFYIGRFTSGAANDSVTGMIFNFLVKD